MSRLKRTPGPIAQSSPTSPAAEAYHTIRANFQSTITNRNHRVILMTSANQGEGKTLTACNLAVVAAQSKQRVLLIDGNLRHPALHTQFGIANDSGLSTVLVGENAKPEFTRIPTIDGLSVLPSGPKTSNPAAALSSDGLHRLINQVRQEFDLVILDGPPILTVSDALIMSQVADGIVFVIDAQKTNRYIAQRAIAAIQQVNQNIVGGIVNRVPKYVQKYPVGMSVEQGVLSTPMTT